MAQGSSQGQPTQVDTPDIGDKRSGRAAESGRGTHRAHKMTENSVWRREQGTTDRAVNLSVWVG